jgi:hypothetical protein
LLSCETHEILKSKGEWERTAEGDEDALLAAREAVNPHALPQAADDVQLHEDGHH